MAIKQVLDKSKADFQGWATKNDLRCRDERIIRHGAFEVNDGKVVPLVWNHQHNNPSCVLGKVLLENRDEGVWAYGFFNGTSAAKDAKEQVMHGDVTNMSIWANDLVQRGCDVMHGIIREVSLVLAGANPGAFVESVLEHGVTMDESDEEGIFYTDDDIMVHSAIEQNEDESKKKKSEEDGDESKEEPKKEEGKTVGEVYNAFNDEQKKVVAIIATEMVKEATGKKEGSDDNKEDKEMKHNAFEAQGQARNILSHSDTEALFASARRIGSMREAVNEALQDGGILAHAMEVPMAGMEGPDSSKHQSYGFNTPDMLFPDFKSLNNPPEFISREMGWVQVVLGGVHHTPFSRIKSQFANITEDEARAKGYIKGNQKKEEVFSLLKRVTSPTTIYKLQKMDRDDIIDITDFDVVAWIKAEMRMMLDEEIARAILIGDGRLASDEFKIKEDCIRPIAKEADLFNTKYDVTVPAAADAGAIADATIDGAIRARKKYKGSGNPTFFTTEDVLTEMLLLKDGIGHKLYKSEAEVATALRVSKIVTVEVMEDQKIDDKPLIGVIVNLADYNVGADKGGEINMFDDFDINFNKYEYLIETRISGALTKPFSAITMLLNKSGAASSRTGRSDV